MNQEIHLSHLLDVIDVGRDDGPNKDIAGQKAIDTAQKDLSIMLSTVKIC